MILKIKQKYHFISHGIIDGLRKRIHPIGKRQFYTLIIFGFILRISAAFLFGTIDMEYWKAYTVESVKGGLVNIYGKQDGVIVEQYKKGISIRNILHDTQNIWTYEGYKSAKSTYDYPQPPIYIYSLYLTGLLYSFIDTNLSNNRIFNFFLNLDPILSSFFIVIILYKFVSKLTNVHEARAIGLLYWLNPLVLLNSPIQGYRDALMAMFVLLSIINVYKNNLNFSWIFLVLGMATKPQGILIFPIVLFSGLFQHSIKKNVIAWIVAIGSSVIIASPFITSQHGLSMLLGMASISRVTVALSGTPNIWLILQYIIEVLYSVGRNVPIFDAVFGYSFKHVMIKQFYIQSGFNLEWVGYTLLIVFTAVNIYFLRTALKKKNNFYIFLAGVIQIYAYVMLRVGVQINHYFSLIPLFTVILVKYKKMFPNFIILVSIYITYDLLFYGLGRDFTGVYLFLEQKYLLWMINILAAINIGVFLTLSQQVWKIGVGKGRQHNYD